MMTAHTLFWWEDADAVPDSPEALEALDAHFEGEAKRRDALEAELDKAAAEIQNAHARYEEAMRRFRLAPHGELGCRRADLRSANHRILQAEVRFAEIKRQEPRWD